VVISTTIMGDQVFHGMIVSIFCRSCDQSGRDIEFVFELGGVVAG
jgi:hypothetical protein